MAALRHPYAVPCPVTYASRLPARVPLKNDDYILMASLRGVVQSTHHKYVCRSDANNILLAMLRNFPATPVAKPTNGTGIWAT